MSLVLALGRCWKSAALSLISLGAIAMPSWGQAAEDLKPPESPDIFADIPVLGTGCKIFPDQVNLDLPQRAEEVRITTNLSLTLEEVIDCSLFNSRDLESAYLKLGAAQQQWQAAKAAYYPDVKIRADAQFFNAEDGKRLKQLVFLGGPTVSYDILTFGRRDSELAITTANVRIAELTVGLVAEKLQYLSTLAYYDMQEAKEELRIRELALKEAEQILGGTRQSIAESEQGGEASELPKLFSQDESRNIQDALQGIEQRREFLLKSFSNPLDVERAELLLVETERDLEIAKAKQKIAHRRLASLLMVEDNEGVTLAEDIKITESWSQTLEESIIQAFQNRAELNAVLAEREKQNQTRRRKLADLKPKLGISAGYGGAFILNSFEFFDGGRSGQLDFEWNPFDFSGRVRADAAASRRRAEAAEADFARAKSNIRFEVERAYYKLEEAAKNGVRFKRAEDRAFRTLELARTGAGLAGQLDLLEAQKEYTDARLDVILNQLAYNRSLAGLKFAVGGLGLFPARSVEFPGDEDLRRRLFEVIPPKPEGKSKSEESEPAELQEDEVEPLTSKTPPSSHPSLQAGNQSELDTGVYTSSTELLSQETVDSEEELSE